MPPAITYRTAGPWGAGKGANLTATEFDTNNYELAQAIAGITALEPNEIVSVTQTGNTFTIHMEDGSTFGPFNLPVANIAFRGEWEDATDYIYGDMFTFNNTLYFVQNDHTSSAPFDPNAAIPAGPLYAAIMPFPADFSVGTFFPGKPSLGIEVDAPSFRYVFDRNVWFPIGLTGSQFNLRIAPAVDLEYSIMRDDADEIGFLTFTAGSGVPVIEFTDPQQFEPNDVLSFVLASSEPDADARDMNLTIKGILGSIPS